MTGIFETRSFGMASWFWTRKIRKRAWLWCIPVLVLAPWHLNPAHAEDVTFKLVRGPGSNPYLELSQKLEKAISGRKLPRNICPQDIPIPEDDPDFRRPRWEVLDPLQNKELVLRLFWSRFDRTGNMTPAQREAVWNAQSISRIARDGSTANLSPANAIANGDIGLGRSHFDINFDGIVDTVFRLGLDSCSRPDPDKGTDFYYGFHVIDETDPDLVKGAQRIAGLGIGAAFWFKGRTYLLSRTPEIIVRETIPVKRSYGSLGLIPVCVFSSIHSSTE